MTTRTVTVADVGSIRSLAVDTGMFSPDEAGFVDEMVAGSLDGSLEDHHWLVRVDGAGQVVGAAYYAPEPFSDRMWNLYFLAVAPSDQGNGVGAALIEAVEHSLVDRGPTVAQALIVETSSTDQYARTREFYPKQGYVEEGRIRRFYGPDDDKVVFWKSLAD